MPWWGTVSCRSARVGAATTPPASSLRRLIPCARLGARQLVVVWFRHNEILTDQNLTRQPACQNRLDGAATAVELDGQYRALREAAGVARARRPARCSRSAAPRRPSTCRASSPTTSRRSSPASGCYSALLDRKGHMQGDMRVLRTRRRLRHRHRGIAGDAILRHLGMYKIGREVELEDVTAERAVVSVVGPAATELALGGPLGPEHAHREAERRRHATAARSPPTSASTCSSARASVERCSRALADRGRRAGQRGGGRDRAGRERAPALRARDDDRDDPPGGRDQRARGQLHQGLLHRPGDRRPAALQGQAEPPPARPAARRRRPRAGDPIRLGERELGTVGHRGRLPRPRPDRARDRAPRGRAGGHGRGRRRRPRPRSSSCRSERRPAPARAGFG